jgi:hypothetical protein
MEFPVSLILQRDVYESPTWWPEKVICPITRLTRQVEFVGEKCKLRRVTKFSGAFGNTLDAAFVQSDRSV